MIQGFNPRTGERTGKPVAETTDAEVDAAVAAAAAARPAWAGLGDEGRARALAAVADALDARAGELVPLADEETALGETRLTGEVARTTGQLRLFAGVLRDGGYADAVAPGRRRDRGDPADQPPCRAGRGVRRVQLPVRVLGGRRGHGLRARGRLPGGRQGARGASGHLRSDRADRRRGPGRRGVPAGTHRLVHGFEAGVRLLTHPAISAAGFTGSTRGGLSWPGSAPSGTCRSRSTASSARWTRWRRCPVPRPPAAPGSRPATRCG